MPPLPKPGSITTTPAASSASGIKTPVLETPRLILREINPDIADEIFTKLTDEDIIAFMGLKDNEGLKTERYKWENGMTTYRMTYKRFILTDKATAIAFGSCSLHNWYPEHKRAELGYDIKYEEMKNKGYMKETVAAVLAFGFDKMELNRIEAYIGPANEPSLRLVKGFGFMEEGRLRAHYTSGGKTEDSLCFGLLKSEYDTAKKIQG